MRISRLELAGILGPVLSWELMQKFGGHRIPRLSEDARQRNERDRAIQADLDAGYTYDEAAERNNVSRATVRRASQRQVQSCAA